MMVYNKELAKALESLPTLAEGQADDLKIDTGTYRIWVSRVEEGVVDIEKLVNGRWELVTGEESKKRLREVVD